MDTVVEKVMDFLNSLARRVEVEFAEDSARQGSEVTNYAVSIAQCITDHPTDDYQLLDSVTTVTLQ
ncbi:hypothetical protein ACWF94_21130 [Streptomyces sp. NPDC055078]